MILNLADISHLKELKAVGEHGRTIRAFNTRGGTLNGPGAGSISDHEAGAKTPSWSTPNDAAIKLRSH
jgi:hypothetical protein